MHVTVSENPAEDAGNHISTFLKSQNSKVLLLLSGGSSLSVLEYIEEFALGPHITVLMADERFSTDKNINNYLQLSNHLFFGKLKRRHVTCIETVPTDTVKNPHNFAIGIEKTLRYYLKLNEDAKVIALFGIGADGHFASIFPKEKREDFYKRYHSDNLYIGLHEADNEHPDRTTITPYFVKTHINNVVLYAHSNDKCDSVLPRLKDDTEKEHTLPALILARHQNSHLFTNCTQIDTQD